MITPDRSTNCYLSLATILTPSTAQEVSKILLRIRFLDATFSIRGGGHLQNPGFTSNNGGVVISLSKFTQCILSEEQKTVDVWAWIEMA
jgi:FAD/FMN-containing dehydrogenase